jgi:hypothetical protein
MARHAFSRAERGQTAVEYMGVLVVVAVIIAALVGSGLPRKLETMIRQQICAVAKGGEACTAAEVRRAARRARKRDRDQDGLSNREERRLGTDPRKADTDGDGIADGEEARRKLDPRSRDTDRDGIEDARELRRPRNPMERTDPRKADSDGDGLTDGQEAALGTRAGTRDGDDGFDDHGDGLSDYDEVFIYGTDPQRQDTDGDGVHDGKEVRDGTNPLVDERSLGDKVGPEVLGIFLDDPFSGGRGGAVNKLRQGLGKIKDKLRSIVGKAPKQAIDDAAENIAAAQRRREAADQTATGRRGPTPYEEARSGGRHAGFLRNYEGRSPEEIDRGIRSIEKQIADHESWIAMPTRKIPNWEKLDPRQRKALVERKWPADIARQREQLSILKELRRRAGAP